MQKAEEMQRTSMRVDNARPLSRPAKLKRFILDIVKDAGETLQNELLSDYEKQCKKAMARKDSALIQPFETAERWANGMAASRTDVFKKDLDAIKVHVERCYEEYCSRLHDHQNQSPKKPGRMPIPAQRTPSLTGAESKNQRPMIIRDVALTFSQNPPNISLPPTSIDEIKASYAYKFAFEKSSSGVRATDFPFDVAHMRLCSIKAATEGLVSSTREYADFLITHGKLLQVAHDAEEQ